MVTQPLFPTRPVIVDAFCCGGVGAEGYIDAGFDVVGVDLDDHHASYPGRFIRGDVFELLPHLVRRWRPVFVHASPPCQGYCTMPVKHRGKGTVADERKREIARTRDLLLTLDVPFVIENVGGARREMRNPVTLTGGMFGLDVHRPRLFEAHGFSLLAPPRAPKSPGCVGVYGTYPDGRRLWTRKDGSELRCVSSVEEGRRAMGIKSTRHTWREVTEAIPPAYTRYIGQMAARQLLETP